MARVLMLAPTPFFSDRGCHVRIYEQARYLTAQGRPPILLTYPIGDDPPGVAVQRVAALTGYRDVAPGPAWPRLILDAQVLARAWQLCRRERPDLIHAHLHEGALIGAILARRFGVPLLFDYQGSLTGESVQHGFIPEHGLRNALFRTIERALDRCADRIVVSASSLAESLAAAGLPVETLADGVDPQRFTPGPASAELAARLGLPPDRPLLVYLGAMTDYQGVDILLRACRLFQQWSRPVHLLLMGYPEQEYRRRAGRMGLDSLITFTGRLNYFQAPEHLRLGAIALAPKLSRTEANGKVLTYMAAGLPVVAFDLPVNREILGPHAAWVEPAVDRDTCAERFARAVSALLDDPERAGALAAAGRERARADLTIAAQGARLEAIYAEMTAAHAARSPTSAAKLWRLAAHQLDRGAAAVDHAVLRLTRRLRPRSESEREADHWARARPAEVLTWQDHPLIQAHINRLVSGDPAANWLEHFFRAGAPPGGFERALNLGCGQGGLEAHALSRGAVRRFHSLDLSPAAVAAARKLLAGQPVEFEIVDINRIELAPEQYDVVFAASSLHHFIALEHVFDQVRAALRPGGWLVFDEYVGPARLQWRDAQLDAVNALLAALPARYRRDRRSAWRVKRRLYRPPLDERNRDSPFEAARSEEILPLTAERFTIVSRRDYGGAVLHPLLDGIAGNFHGERVEDVALLRRLAALDLDLMRRGVLASDFTTVIARKEGP
jgi:glycosyltransferase involved in cell wall biosynthesis/SAM-dependent methyltransferase